MSDLGELFAEVQSESDSIESDVSADLGGEADQVDNLDPAVVGDGPTDVDEGVTAETDNPADVDNDVDAGTGDEPFDWQAYADQLVPIVHNGEETKVSLKELRDGFMRHDDYTRKTQEVAQVRERAQWAESVQAAFDRDPAGTIRAFAEAYGLLEQANNQGQSNGSLDDLDEDVRPFAERALQAEQQVAEVRRQMEAIEYQRIQDEVRAEMADMKSRYGDSFDPEATLREAAARNITLEDAHVLLMGRQYLTSQQRDALAGSAAEQAAAQAAAAAEQQRKQAKKVASSTQTQSFKASDIPVDDFNDIGELMEQIVAQQGS